MQIRFALLTLALLASTPSLAQDRVQIDTSSGSILVQLFPQQAPATVANFIKHVQAKYYDGLIFHRVIPNFMIQGGGYDAQMKPREPLGTVVNESGNGLRNERGTLAMARTSDPDSADSQFFINVRTNPHLDGAPGRPGYAVFGRVIKGMDVAEMIELSDTGIAQGMAGVPITPIVILKITLLEDAAKSD